MLGYLFYCLLKSYYLIRKTPPSNHIAPLPTGEGLGVGLCVAFWALRILHKFRKRCVLVSVEHTLQYILASAVGYEHVNTFVRNAKSGVALARHTATSERALAVVDILLYLVRRAYGTYCRLRAVGIGRA